MDRRSSGYGGLDHQATTNRLGPLDHTPYAPAAWFGVNMRLLASSIVNREADHGARISRIGETDGDGGRMGMLLSIHDRLTHDTDNLALDDRHNGLRLPL